ncbi:MAG: hypothetical protein RL161_1139 [Bacteroidota bacterium]
MNLNFILKKGLNFNPFFIALTVVLSHQITASIYVNYPL